MDKSPDAFRTISEVADELDLPQHVLRFWETRFTQIRPLKRGGGRRYYRPEDLDLLRGIRQLLYGEGYTIKGVQRILKEEGLRFVQSVGRGEEAASAAVRGAAASAELEEEEVLMGADPGQDDANHGATATAMSETMIEQLKGALDELVECDRVLSTLKMPSEPSPVE